MSVAVNEFMMDLHKQLLERKLAETTVTNYIKTLWMLNDKKPFKSLAFLKKHEDIHKKLEPYAESTKNTIVAAISSVLSLFKEKGPYKKTYTYYSDLLKERKSGGEAKPTNEMTEKEKDAWLSWEDVEKRRNEIYEEILKFKNPKTVTPEQFQTYLNYVVLSLYTLLPPRRNQDYLNMRVVGKWTPEMSTDVNYIDMGGSGTPTKFVFNKYKTAKKHGQQLIDIPKELADALLTYLKHHPVRSHIIRRKTYDYPFLVTATGDPLKSQNAITRLLNKVFGKKVGSSMLRHIFLSNKYSIDEMQKDADLMAHSVATQRTYLRSEDAPTMVLGDADAAEKK
jgi:hypothetical protein